MPSPFNLHTVVLRLSQNNLQWGSVAFLKENKRQFQVKDFFFFLPQSQFSTYMYELNQNQNSY